MPDKRAVGVLAGGDSPERDVSLRSGACVHRALVAQGRNASLLVIGSLDELVPSLRGIDLVFNCLHGGAGEDGTVQLLLDVMGIPYAGSGARACLRAMDKGRTRSILAAHEIPLPRGEFCTAATAETALRDLPDRLGYPLVAKPGTGGSSLSVFFVSNARELSAAAKSILAHFPSLVVEEYIEGREMTVGILRHDAADAALPVVEIRIPHELFDYEAKYTEGVADFLAPAPIDEDVAGQLQEVSLRAHDALGCAGFSRVDLRLGRDGTPYVLEVNALPGMTPMSDLPRAADAAGIPYPRLVDIMLGTAGPKEGR